MTRRTITKSDPSIKSDPALPPRSAPKIEPNNNQVIEPNDCFSGFPTRVISSYPTSTTTTAAADDVPNNPVVPIVTSSVSPFSTTTTTTTTIDGVGVKQEVFDVDSSQFDFQNPFLDNNTTFTTEDDPSTTAADHEEPFFKQEAAECEREISYLTGQLDAQDGTYAAMLAQIHDEKAAATNMLKRKREEAEELQMILEHEQQAHKKLIQELRLRKQDNIQLASRYEQEKDTIHLLRAENEKLEQIKQNLINDNQVLKKRREDSTKLIVQRLKLIGKQHSENNLNDVQDENKHLLAQLKELEDKVKDKNAAYDAAYENENNEDSDSGSEDPLDEIF